MRVFYEEEEISKRMRQYFVKIDNVSVPDDKRKYKALESLSIDELKNKIIEYYGFDKISANNIQLWTNSGYSGTRLDVMEEIPINIDSMWVRVVLNKIK